MKCPNFLNFADKRAAAAATSLAALAMATILLSGCGQSASTDAPELAAGAQGSNSVELTGDQLNAIKIEPIGTHIFPLEKEEVGTVFFDENPDTVQAESTLLAAAAAEEAATNVLARAQALYDTNGVSRAELEQDIATEETDLAALKAARDAVRALGQTDEDIDALIAAGRIEAAQGRHGQPKWVLANVMESDIPEIQLKQPVKVRVTSFPGRVFQGTVSKIYATVDPNIHRMAVRCEVGDPANELRAGMLATITIEIASPVEATAIPVNGVVREGDGTMTAWVTTDRRLFVQKVIKIGLQDGGMDQVQDGLQAGELAVTDGAIFLDNMLQAPPSD